MGLDSIPKERKVAILLHTIRYKTLEKYYMLRLTNEESKVLTNVIKTF